MIFNSDPFLTQAPKQLLGHNHGVSKPGRCVSCARFAAKAKTSRNCHLSKDPPSLPGCGEHIATLRSEFYHSQGTCGAFLVDFFMDHQVKVKIISESRVYPSLRLPVKVTAASCSLGFTWCLLPDVGSLQMLLQPKLEVALLFPSCSCVVLSPQATPDVGVSHQLPGNCVL